MSDESPRQLVELADRLRLAGQLDSAGAPLLDRETSAALNLAGLAELAAVAECEGGDSGDWHDADCPDSATLTRYAEGRTRSNSERRRIWQHLDHCLACRREVGEVDPR